MKTGDRFCAAILAPLAHGARYTEGGVELTLPDGLWRTREQLATIVNGYFKEY